MNNFEHLRDLFSKGKLKNEIVIFLTNYVDQELKTLIQEDHGEFRFKFLNILFQIEIIQNQIAVFDFLVELFRDYDFGLEEKSLLHFYEKEIVFHGSHQNT